MTLAVLPSPWCPPDPGGLVWVVVALTVMGVILDRAP